MSNIVGTLPAKHTVDPNGSLNIDVPIQLPPSNLDPGISFSYHSAAQDMGDMGPGWVIRGLAVIERVGATRVQDGFLGRRLCRSSSPMFLTYLLDQALSVTTRTIASP